MALEKKAYAEDGKEFKFKSRDGNPNKFVLMRIKLADKNKKLYNVSYYEFSSSQETDNNP